MKRQALAAAMVLLLAAPAVAQDRATVADLAWIGGAWINEADGTVTREVWHGPLAGAMSGVGQVTKPGKPPWFEFMTITTEAAGPTFTAYIKGQPATPFVLKPGGKDEAVFENLAHDFPQRVIYRRCDADLCAAIEGTVNGAAKRIEWRFTRVR